MTRTRLAVVGVGHLGKEHARILSGMPDVDLVGVVDVNRQQAEAVALRCNTRAYDDFPALLGKVDAAVIVVPTTYHLKVASVFLQHGIHTLVEKPLALNLGDSRTLELLARQRGLILQVGHIERFNPAWEELTRRPLTPKFISSERLSPFSGRSTDIGVVLDMMIHDLDLVLSHVASPVVDVQALGISVLGGHEDIVQAMLQFENGCVVQLRASRVQPTASRQMQIWGPEGFAAVDFGKRRLTLVQPSTTLQQLRRDRRRLDGASLNVLKNELFTQHLPAQEIDCTAPADQLTLELEDFVHSIRTGTQPRVTGTAACGAMALAERILDAVKAHRWEGTADGAVGPHHLPMPQGALFEYMPGKAAA
jgi:predicted dehydrogenase